jgi:hypothetical protein
MMIRVVDVDEEGKEELSGVYRYENGIVILVDEE